MKRKFLHLTATILLVTLSASAALSQRARAAAAAKPQSDLLASLPQSDAVATVEVHRLLNEAVPKILAENPAKLAEVNDEIEKFKTKTGVDPRAFDQLVLGMSYNYPAPGTTKVDTVVLARGSFNPAAFVAAGRIAANGKYREEKYQGHSIYIFSLDQQLKIFGLFNVRVGDLAVTALGSDVLALGNPTAVRRVIDAGKSSRSTNRELIALATQDPQAIIGFGGNVSPTLLKNLNLANEAVARDVSSIRQVYGTVGLTDKDLEMFLAARTTDADSAKNLSDTIEGLKTLGAMFVGRLPAPRGTVARTALDNLKITTQGNELRIRTAVAQAQIGPLLRSE